MKPSKENAMLLDIQYIKPSKRDGETDILYVIWKDLDTGNKYLQQTREPKMDIYFEKPEFRNHSHNKNYQHIENLFKQTVKYKDIPFAIAEEMGDVGKARLNEIFQTKNYGKLREFQLYPYVFGSDFDIKGWYRTEWIKKLNNDRVKKIDKGFMDIEVDGFGYDGMPEPRLCPVNAVSFIDAKNLTVNVFLLSPEPYVRPNRHFTPSQEKFEKYKKKMVENRYKLYLELKEDIDGFKNELHDMFDESYPDFKYNLYFYEDERKLLVHLFQLINILKLDMIAFWNMGFDIPYMIERMTFLGLDPKDVMCHPDFPIKECRYKEDTHNFEVKNKTDFFYLSSYTTFIDQMILYAAIRKGGQELRSYKLNSVALKELKDSKLDYHEEGNIKTLPYLDFKKFIAYNIKDTLLQYGIEKRTSDFDTYYIGSYKNATPYDSVFKQTIKLRNVQLLSFFNQGLIPGNNINIFNYDNIKAESDDDDDDSDSKFEGAAVARPELNLPIGVEMYGHKSNNVFKYAIDMDMSAFYPSSIGACNIDASTLIFKTVIPRDTFSGKFKLKEYISPNDIKLDKRKDSDDISKTIIANLQTGNKMSTGYKILNLPSVDDVYKKLKKRLG